MIFDSWSPPWHGLIAAAIGGLVVYVYLKIQKARRLRRLRERIERADRRRRP